MDFSAQPGHVIKDSSPNYSLIHLVKTVSQDYAHPDDFPFAGNAGGGIRGLLFQLRKGFANDDEMAFYGGLGSLILAVFCKGYAGGELGNGLNGVGNALQPLPVSPRHKESAGQPVRGSSRCLPRPVLPELGKRR